MHVFMEPQGCVFCWSLFQPADVCQVIGLGIARAAERLVSIDMVKSVHLLLYCAVLSLRFLPELGAEANWHLGVPFPLPEAPSTAIRGDVDI